MTKTKQHKRIFREIAACLLAGSIPAMLAANVVQAYRYSLLENDVSALEAKQTALFEDNKRLLTGISVLTSSERIEEAAITELGMKKAETHDIVRVEVRGKAQ